MKAPPSLASEVAAILRLHIVGVALFATVVFGWLFTGARPWALVPLVAIDWFVINLVNRVTDLAEDLRNGIPGTERVARRARELTVGAVVLFAGSLAVSHLLVSPALTPWRLLVQVIGLTYNVRLVPTPRGRSRWKELYFFKNTMSAVLFVLTCFVYPLAAAEARVMPLEAVVWLGAFFFPFELSYEILYDFRDLDGDRAEGVPTYPVVHGERTARRIFVGLLVLAELALAGGLLRGALGAREALMMVAPLAQWLFAGPKLARGLSHEDCVRLTHLGSAQLVVFLVGTELWLRAGLPANVFLR